MPGAAPTWRSVQYQRGTVSFRRDGIWSDLPSFTVRMLDGMGLSSSGISSLVRTLACRDTAGGRNAREQKWSRNAFLPFVLDSRRLTIQFEKDDVFREYAGAQWVLGKLGLQLGADLGAAHCEQRGVYLRVRSEFRCARRVCLKGCGALTVEVVDDLDPGGLGLNGVDESEVVVHGIDDGHVVVVLPAWRSTTWKINWWVGINFISADLSGYSRSLWYTKRPGVSVFLARWDTDQHPVGLKG